MGSIPHPGYMTTRLRNLAARMNEIGLPYETTDNLNFVLSGGKAVVALYQHGDVQAAFVGFNHEGDALDQVISQARGVRGVHSVYTVNSERQED